MQAMHGISVRFVPQLCACERPVLFTCTTSCLHGVHCPCMVSRMRKTNKRACAIVCACEWGLREDVQ